MELLNIVNGCIEMEKAVASIYGFFMQLFPEERPFWEDLFKDEMQHQSWLMDSHFFESIDLLPSTDILPSMELIKSSLQIAADTSRRIKSGPVTLEEALKTALRLEKLMVETFANELMANVFASGYQSLGEKILFAERLHIGKIEDMMIERGFLQLS